MSANKAFNAYVKTPHFIDVQHEDGCAWGRGLIPIDECMCHCYIKAIFTAGYQAAKGISNKSKQS